MNRRLFIVLSIIAVNLMACCCGGLPPKTTNATVSPDSARVRVTHQQYGDDWPFTVESGELQCKEHRMLIFHANNGTTYGLNGVALDMGKYPAPDPIWRNDPKNPGGKINIGRVLDDAFKLCK